MIIWRMCIAYSIPKATNTHSKYVIFIVIPLQQWLHERASVLHYTYIASILELHTHEVLLCLFALFAKYSFIYLM